MSSSLLRDLGDVKELSWESVRSNTADVPGVTGKPCVVRFGVFKLYL